MVKYWCKVCGEPLRPTEGALVAACASCGARQALPSPIDDEYLAHFGELGRLVREGDFGSAQMLADAMIVKSEKDSALYWQRVMCTYKAAYSSKLDKSEYVITCGEETDAPVSENEDFCNALRFAGPAQRGIYEEDGRLLERARRIILGEPYVPDETVLPLNRGFLCLEDGEWTAANEQFDIVIKDEPENALAYFGKMMAELRVRRESELSNLGTMIPETENHKYVLQYGDESLRERLNRYWESGLLLKAAEECELAVTVDDWKRIKKLFNQIPNNPMAQEQSVFCDKKIREIMSREGQVVVGCREAANLGITTETLGARMVNADYYYDFDMSDQSSGVRRKKDLVSAFAIGALIALLILVAILFVFPIAGGEKSRKIDNSGLEGSLGDTGTTESSGRIYGDPEFQSAGEFMFVLDVNGTVRCISEKPDDSAKVTLQSGASFSGNVTPYASDWSSWDGVSKLYSTPDGMMLFGVLDNGTIVYDIFAAEQMSYEAAYSTVSEWENVSELAVDPISQERSCIFALTESGVVLSSDAAAKEAVDSEAAPYYEQGIMAEKIAAAGGYVYIIFDNDDYISVQYSN